MENKEELNSQEKNRCAICGISELYKLINEYENVCSLSCQSKVMIHKRASCKKCGIDFMSEGYAMAHAICMHGPKRSSNKSQ